MIEPGTDAMVARIRYLGRPGSTTRSTSWLRSRGVGTTSAVVAVSAQRASGGGVLAEGELRHDASTLAKRELPPHVREGLLRYAAEPREQRRVSG